MEYTEFYDVDLDDIKYNIEKRAGHYDETNIYILPEIFGENEDILNEFAPDFKKILIKNGEQCKLVYNSSKFSYLSLRDADIILPTILAISTGVIANFLTDFIKERIDSSKTVKVKFISQHNTREYKKAEIEGSKESVIEVLEKLKEL